MRDGVFFTSHNVFKNILRNWVYMLTSIFITSRSLDNFSLAEPKTQRNRLLLTTLFRRQYAAICFRRQTNIVWRKSCQFCIKRLTHRVYRVLGFLSLHRNWVPHPFTRKWVLSPSFWSKGGDTLGAQFRGRDRHSRFHVYYNPSLNGKTV